MGTLNAGCHVNDMTTHLRYHLMCPRSDESSEPPATASINSHTRPTETHPLMSHSQSRASSLSQIHDRNLLTLCRPLSIPLESSRLVVAKKYSVSMRPQARVAMVIVALATVLMAQGTQGQCPSNDLSSCLPAAEADVQPSETCCANLQAYAETNPEVCLCEAGTTFVDDANANPVYAIEIPEKCNLQYPAGITCGDFVIPGGQ